MTTHLKFYIINFVLVVIASISAFGSFLSYRTTSDYKIYIETLDRRTNEITAKLVQQQEEDRILNFKIDRLKTELDRKDEAIRQLNIQVQEMSKKRKR
jgi:predicted  nucleic acid-binding Zn-ribbon protein